LKTIFSFLFFCLGAISLNAFPSAEGKTISSIEIIIDWPLTVGKSYILQNLQIEEGIPYTSSAIDKSIRNLIDTGSIRDVKVFLDPQAVNNNQISLVFKVFTKARIGNIQFEGNNDLTDKKLKKAITSKVGKPLDYSQLNSDSRELETLYLEKGYWNVRVNSKVLESPQVEKDSVILVFEIEESEKRKISKLRFQGNFNFNEGELLDEMETAPWRFWRFWSKRSKYRPKILEEDLEKIREAYRNKGFLGVNINQQDVRITPVGTNKLEVLINVSEGNQSYFGQSILKGNGVLTEDEIQQETLIKQGVTYSPSVLSEERKRIQRIYGERGYLDAVVRIERVPNLSTGQIDLEFEITENNKFSVNTVKVRGNEKTKTIVLLRELALAPGETFDLTRMEVDEGRLMNTKLFEKVSVSDEPIDSMDGELRNSRRNMVVDVEEGKTGHLGFGVGFSTLEKAMMFAEIRQGNFDIMRWRSPNRFQGDGQKFRLKLKLGSRSNEARLAIEEPWFMNRRVAAGFELFREKSDYQSSYYDELRAGFEIYFRKRIYELVEGRLFYSLEDVLINDIDRTTPRTNWIRQDKSYNDVSNEIKRTISKVGITLSRDTRPELLFPSQGSVVSVRKEFAGGVFGGDADYGRLEIQGARFFKTFDEFEQVLTISG